LKLYDWFVSQRQRREKVDGRMDPSVLPGWAYTRALALRMEEDVRKNVVCSSLFSEMFEAMIRST
jgi:hypothetical protein